MKKGEKENFYFQRGAYYKSSYLSFMETDSFLIEENHVVFGGERGCF